MRFSKQDLRRICREKMQNQALTYEEFGERKLKLSGLPSKVILELTQNCNFKCKMCPHTILPQYARYSPKLNMPLELFDKVAAQLFPKAYSVDLRGFGESLILPYWPQILDRLDDYPLINWNLVTNLSYPKQDVWERMAKQGFIIGFSCDGGTKEVFEAIRIGGRFEKIEKNLEALSGSIRKHNRGHLYFISVVQKKNIDDLPNIIELAHRHSVSDVQFKMVMGADHEESIPASARKRLQKTLERCLDLAIDYGISLSLNDAGLERGLDGDKVRKAARAKTGSSTVNFPPAPETDPEFFKSIRWKKVEQLVHDTVRVKEHKRCFKPFHLTYVASDGRVGVCNHMMNPHLLEMGDLKKQPFGEIWNGENYQFFRASVLYARGAPTCMWCFKHRLAD